MRIVSYNIHKGFSLGNWRYMLDELKCALWELDPCVVLLQEVIGGNRRHQRRVAGWPEASQTEYIAGRDRPFFVYGRNARYAHGHHGNGIISRFPIVDWGNFDLTTNPFEQRGLLWARLAPEADQRTILVATTHLNLFNRGRRYQLHTIADQVNAVARPGEPVILGGDFNDWSEGASRWLERHAGFREIFLALGRRHGRTYPARLPVLPLDRIYVRECGVRSAMVLGGKPWIGLSDHLPIFAELGL